MADRMGILDGTMCIKNGDYYQCYICKDWYIANRQPSLESGHRCDHDNEKPVHVVQSQGLVRITPLVSRRCDDRRINKDRRNDNLQK